MGNNVAVTRVRGTDHRLAAVLLLCGLLVSCTDAGDPSAGPGTGDASAAVSTATAPAITLTRPDAPFALSIGQLSGAMPTSRRNRLRRAIGAPVSTWFEHAFLHVDYPAAEFPGAFDSWTRGSIDAAAHDRDVTTNASLGPDLLAVVADTQRATLFVFADHGVAGGATAKVKLAMTGQKKDGALVDYSVQGDLYLTRDKGRWSIFGYDLHRSVGES